MNCNYCFVSKRNETMEEDIRTFIISYINNSISVIRNLSITWMGGEPLVVSDLIINMSNQIKKICEANKITYNSRILSNGLLLNREIALQLSEAGINQIQISIDGSSYLQNKRRKVENVENSYIKILENISSSCDILNIGLRVNIDRNNGNDIDKLLDDLEEKKLKRKIYITFGQIVSFEGACSQVEKQCYTKKEFSDIEIKLYEKAVNKGFLFGYLPFPSVMFCGALSDNSLTIDPNGDIHKCWNFIGNHQNRVGIITKDGIVFNENNKLWSEYDPYTIKDCIDCNIFPLCTGGCPYNALVLKQSYPQNCIPWKWNLNRVISLSCKSGGDIN